MKKAIKLTGMLAAFLLLCGCVSQGVAETVPTSPSQPTQPTQPTHSSHATQSTAPQTRPTTPDPVITEPQSEGFVLSFAGDCTMGDNFDEEGERGTYTWVVGNNYQYPFSNVRYLFEDDDMTFVNLECALTESDPTEEEMEELKEHLFRFRGPVEYAKILSGSSVELASCANNHSQDYGQQGLKDTWAALEAENVPYASFGRPCVYTTESGLKVGVFTVFFGTTKANLESQVKYLKGKGAELVVMSVHWGDEGTYSPNNSQRTLGHMAIDAGVDIVYGHHSHTLQPIEPYKGGIIYYSLGNFSFGGNRNPSDKDTAVIRQQILRYADGTVALGQVEVIPCRVSTSDSWNDFRPTPYKPEEAGYNRVFSKLEGSYDGKDLVVSYPTIPTEPEKTEKNP